MEYTIIVNGRSYDLPKKTISVADKLDSVLRVDESNLKIRQKFEKLHNFIKELVGDENAKEMFGSDNLSEIDLSELTLSIRKVVDAYDKPINDYDIEKQQEKFDSIPMDKIISMTKAAHTIANVEMRK